MKDKKKVLVLLVVTILIFVVPKLINIMKNTTSTVEKELILLEEIDIGYEGDLIYNKLDSGLMQYWDGILYFYDRTGKEKWHVYLGILNPIIKTNNNNIYMIDNNNNQVIRIDDKGTIQYKYTCEEAITNFEVCKDNYIILQFPSQNNIASLKVLDEEGREYSNIQLTEGQVINISISKKHNLIGINTLMVENKMESRLLIYDIEGQLIGSNNLEEQLALGFMYDAKGNMIVVKEEEVISINKNNKTLWEVNLDKISLFDGFSSDYMVFYGGTEARKGLINGNAEDQIKILQYNGKIIGETKLEEKVNHLDTHEETIVLYSPRTIYLLNKRGEIEMIYKYSSDIEEIFVFPKGHLVIVTKGKVSFMQVGQV